MAATSRPVEIEWHRLSTVDAATQLDVDPQQGLNATEVHQLLQQHGSNKLEEKTRESRWRIFLRQYQDYMQLVLLAAAGFSLVIGDVSSAMMLTLLTLLNAFLGLRQEAKAEESLAALRQMMKVTARVRRNATLTEVSAEDLVPGDVVMVEAGDRVPADGRLLVTATLEIEEAALTGESIPSAKATSEIDQDDVPIADRVNMAYMNSSVTRGRGEILVTATGMDTEVGHIAEMLQGTRQRKTPLTKQIDKLTIIIALLAVLALIAVIIVGVLGGQTLEELFRVAVALAVAAIPTGLPVVVTTSLVLGTIQLAQQNAIVKHLPSVETLGTTSVICSDKTGTLTLNQMTAREFLIADHRFRITGEGYSTEGRVLHIGGLASPKLDEVLMPMALASDAVIHDGELVGDPTEGALMVLASKGGLDIEATRAIYPRIAEVPFDSTYKLMATFHQMQDPNGEDVVRCYVKGAPDVLFKRVASMHLPDGRTVPVDDAVRKRLYTANDELAQKGLRVLVVAVRDFTPATFSLESNLLNRVTDLTLLAMVGILDPPRQEVKDAIMTCKRAGIRVCMITGDHATTAAAIAHELGIEGRATTGTEFGKMSDEEVAARVDDMGVIARVAPEHKVRLVAALQNKGNIVAMIGDGVNDAPALKTSDIGVAMGITGTAVSKESAEMILTDDNFATIVEAVELGRMIYDNLIKYIRFQMVGLVGFILAFLGSSLFNVAGVTLFDPLQILWLNFAMQVPLAMALVRDAPTPGLMDQPPRMPDAPVVSRRLAVRLFFSGSIMAAGTLWIYAAARDASGSEVLAQSMALTTFAYFNIFVALNMRFPNMSVFQFDTFVQGGMIYAIGIVLLLSILVVELPLLQRVFNTTSLPPGLWLACVLVASISLWVAELAKFIALKFDLSIE